MIRIHATCVEMGAVAIVLQGPPGSGKSDLATRLIDGGARLVADDQVELNERGGRLWASPPPALAGMLEVRGLGIIRLPHVARTRVGLAVELVPLETIERSALAASCTYEGVTVPLYRLAPFAASTPAKLRLLAHGYELIATA